MFYGKVFGSANSTMPVTFGQIFVAMATKIWKFEYKVNVIGLRSPTHDHKTANINVKKLNSLKFGVRTTR